MYWEDIIELFTQTFQEINQITNDHELSRETMIVGRIIAFMKSHLHENIGLLEIADSVGLSKSSVNSIFKQEMKRTIYDYLIYLRMEEIEAKLADSDMRISEIASHVGYQNENSLIRAFRKTS